MYNHSHDGVPCPNKVCALRPDPVSKIPTGQLQVGDVVRLVSTDGIQVARPTGIQDLQSHEDGDNPSTPPSLVDKLRVRAEALLPDIYDIKTTPPPQGPRISPYAYGEEEGPIHVEDLRMFAIEQVLQKFGHIDTEFYEEVDRMVKYIQTGEHSGPVD